MNDGFPQLWLNCGRKENNEKVVHVHTLKLYHPQQINPGQLVQIQIKFSISLTQPNISITSSLCISV